MKKISKWLRLILLFILFSFLFFFRLPLYLEVPGNLFSLDEIVKVDHQTTDYPGKFYLTTVGIQQLTPITIGRSLFPYQDLVSEAELVGEYEDIESYNQLQRYYMESSMNHAIKSAFDAADKNYDFDYKGVHILQVSEESTFFKELKIGDLVKEIDGVSFESSPALIDYIESKKVGDPVSLEIERDKQLMTLSGTIIELDTKKAGLGISLVDHTEIITEPAVQIDVENIGGPSAGLMFALELYMQLTNENIRGNYRIAGTGTIDSEGNIGRIGGVEKKVVAADREEIDYFFVPKDTLSEEYRKINPEAQSNYEDGLTTIKDIESEMILIPVQTIGEAIQYLEKIQQNEHVFYENTKSIGAIYLNRKVGV